MEVGACDELAVAVDATGVPACGVASVVLTDGDGEGAAVVTDDVGAGVGTCTVIGSCLTVIATA